MNEKIKVYEAMLLAMVAAGDLPAVTQVITGEREPMPLEREVREMNAEAEKQTYIQSLTPPQEALMDKWADMWVQYGSQTGTADFARGLAGIEECYKAMNEPMAKTVYVVDSPLVLCIAHPVINYTLDHLKDAENLTALQELAGTDSWESGVAEDWSATPLKGAWDHTEQEILYTNITNTAVNVVRLWLINTMGLEREQARRVALLAITWTMADERKDSLQTSIDNEWTNYLGGNLWAAYPAYFSFALEVCNLDIGDKTDLAIAYADISRSIGWWYGSSDFCLMSNFPVELHITDGRLHRGDRPAVLWADGTAMSCWRGTRIPNEWTLQGFPSAADILAWPNAEERRCACEIVGYAKILEAVEAKVIADGDTPEQGTLYQADLPGAFGEKFLKAQCGTGRVFAMPVPENVNTVLEAQAWLHDIPVYEFQFPAVRT